VSAVDHDGPSKTDKLVYMANQIATFFGSQPGGSAVAGTADHLRSFWTRAMFKDIYAHLDATGGEGLKPVALEALNLLQAAPKGTVRDTLAAAGLHSSREPGNDAG
jgi:formate dehydrogenase subunit delta